MSTKQLVSKRPGIAGEAEDLAVLLTATASGDQRAFRRLYDLTHCKLLGVALLLLKRRDAAEDALQEAYLRVWNRAGTYDPAKGEALAWLSRITRNIALDRLRQEKNEPETLGVPIDVVAVEPIPVLEMREVEKHIQALSPNQRQALRMSHFEGFSREEVAERLQVPIGTIKSWVFRSTQRIRQSVSL